MPQMVKVLQIAAPADAVWQVLGPGFARIGEWATAIPTSTAIPPAGTRSTGSGGGAGAAGDGVPADLAQAPVAGRVCATGFQVVAQVTETLVAYDEGTRTLTYEASGMPAFVTTARNTWTVAPLDEHRCSVTLDARFDTRGVLGALARWLLLLQVGRASRHLADDLRHYVEHGVPSRRKVRQLARRGRRQRRFPRRESPVL
jgi:hypothetical protein